MRRHDLAELGPLVQSAVGTELANGIVGAATVTAAKGGGVLKTVWTWLSRRRGRPAFEDDDLLTRRRAAISDSARRQAAQLRADQETGRSAVGPWAPPASTRRLARPNTVLTMVRRDGTSPRS